MIDENIKLRLLPTGTLEDIEEERRQLLETLYSLRPDFDKPFQFLTDFLKIQSSINAIDSILESHNQAIFAIAQDREDDTNE